MTFEKVFDKEYILYINIFLIFIFFRQRHKSDILESIILLLLSMKKLLLLVSFFLSLVFVTPSYAATIQSTTSG
jgi:uncharacterized membrane protein YesL